MTTKNRPKAAGLVGEGYANTKEARLMFSGRGIPLGETQIGFAGSPEEAHQQRMSDKEGVGLAVRWEALKALPRSNCLTGQCLSSADTPQPHHPPASKSAQSHRASIYDLLLDPYQE
jgi:hypothetical protein